MTLEDLFARLGNYLEKANSSEQKSKFHLIVSRDLNRDELIVFSKGINVYRIIQEAIHNAIKYCKRQIFH